ncbi:hypothetical protein YQE_06949, partial [Dendroctonus ponderosae]
MPWIKAFSVLLLFISTIKCIPSMATSPVMGSSFSNYVVSTVRVTWTEAFVLCKQSGMELVSIKTAEEHDAIAQALSHYSTKKGVANGYWISARRFTGNSIVWFNSGKPLIYTNFADGQPDNAGNDEECVEFFMPLEKSYKWNDINCGHKAGYICQVRNECY